MAASVASSMSDAEISMRKVVELDLAVKALIQDIKQFDGPEEDLEIYNNQVRETSKALRESVDELDFLAKDVENPSDSQIIAIKVRSYQAEMARNQTALRNAILTCHMRLERNSKNALFDGSSGTRKRVSAKESLAKTSSQITENMMSISRMMAAQVQQSENTMGTLVTSSKQIQDNSEELKSMSHHVQTSKKLLTKYNRREFTDKLLILLALFFFFATVLYIAKKRFFSY